MENSKQNEPKPSKKIQKIKIFQIIQKNFATIGIGPNSAMQLRVFNGKILFTSLTLASFILSNLVYFFKDAETFTEYTQTIYLGSGGILVTLAFIIILLHLNELFKIINDCECLVNTSE